MGFSRESQGVLVTGGTGSVGQALVREFSSKGYRVTFTYATRDERAESLAQETGAIATKLDIEQGVSSIPRDFDVVINNTAVNISDAMAHEVTKQEWDQTLAINLTGPFLLCSRCLPYMLERRSGRIINICSIYSLISVEGNLAYTASKHGLLGITKTIAREYASYGITCNAICPGPIESEMMGRVAARVAAMDGGTAESYLSEVREAIPDKRFALPIEVAELALFLASASAGHINGAAILLDGGQLS